MANLLKCQKCKYLGNCTTPSGKVLCYEKATSILIDLDLLENNSGLTEIASCGENKYFQIGGTNTVIMHVEKKYCILVDHMVGDINLVDQLKNISMRVHQYGNRDWVHTSGNTRIGYRIREIVHGINSVSYYKGLGWTLDHEHETFDERVRNTAFKAVNICEPSHKVRVEIETEEDLDDFIEDLIADENTKCGMYYDANTNSVNTRGRDFVRKA